MNPQTLDKESSQLEQYVWEKSSSVFNYYAGYASNGAIVLWLYYQAFTTSDLAGTRLDLAGILYGTLMGWFLWSFLEYWLHRVVYHKGPAPLRVGHELHHQHPKALLGIPYYVTAVIWISLYWGLAQIFHPGRVAVIMASCWTGYIFYCVVHHSSHHWLLKFPVMKKLRSHHLVHHHHADKNYGMVTSLWDRVFGTHL